MKTFAEIPESEQEDFISSCKKKKLSREDFDLSLEEEYPTNGIGAISRKATVIRLLNGKSNRYPAGNGEAWIVAFEDDLKAGLFD